MISKIFSSDNSILVDAIRGCSVDLKINPNFVNTSGGVSDFGDLTGTQNILLSTGSYTNPAWLNTLEYSKITNAPVIPNSTSDLINDSGFITLADIPPPSDFSSLTGTEEVLLDSVVYNNPTWLNTVAYTKVTGAPSIPNSTSDVINDSGFITLADIPPGSGGGGITIDSNL